jgi:hypothetical protein
MRVGGVTGAVEKNGMADHASCFPAPSFVSYILTVNAIQPPFYKLQSPDKFFQRVFFSKGDFLFQSVAGFFDTVS